MSVPQVPARYILIRKGGTIVTLRQAVLAVWNGQASPAEYDVRLTDTVPQSAPFFNGQGVDVSNQSPQALVLHRPPKTEV
jgi:hypothetical protein